MDTYKVTLPSNKKKTVFFKNLTFSLVTQSILNIPETASELANNQLLEQVIDEEKGVKLEDITINDKYFLLYDLLFRASNKNYKLHYIENCKICKEEHEFYLNYVEHEFLSKSEETITICGKNFIVSPMSYKDSVYIDEMCVKVRDNTKADKKRGMGTNVEINYYLLHLEPADMIEREAAKNKTPEERIQANKVIIKDMEFLEIKDKIIEIRSIILSKLNHGTKCLFNPKDIRIENMFDYDINYCYKQDKQIEQKKSEIKSGSFFFEFDNFFKILVQ